MAAPSLQSYGSVSADERRRGKRIPLHWQLKLIRASGSVLSATTENLSSSGFFCFTADRLTPGEEVDCHIAVPPNHLSSAYNNVTLVCRGRIARIEAAAGRYGVGCQIEDYQIIAEPLAGR